MHLKLRPDKLGKTHLGKNWSIFRGRAKKYTGYGKKISGKPLCSTRRLAKKGRGYPRDERWKLIREAKPQKLGLLLQKSRKKRKVLLGNYQGK